MIGSLSIHTKRDGNGVIAVKGAVEYIRIVVPGDVQGETVIVDKTTLRDPLAKLTISNCTKNMEVNILILQILGCVKSLGRLGEGILKWDCIAFSQMNLIIG